MMRFATLVCLLAVTATAFAQRKPNPVFAPIEDEPTLPRVLLIGDSISIGYTLAVREELKGVANVHRPPTNCGPTTRGLTGIEDWLGEKPWDVIHFNWGLHDLKYMNAKGALTDVDAGQQQVSPEDYEKNLDQLVRRLKQSGAKLIWCQTTPVPKGAKGRIPDDVLKYNAIATKVMQRHEVAIDDLYTFANERLQKIQKKADVHYTPEGSKVLAKQVADEIRKQLGK